MSGLETEFPGAVKAKNVSARDPESQKVIKEAGFETHGLIIRNTKSEIVWKQADHTVKMDEVRAAIRKLLASESRNGS